MNIPLRTPVVALLAGVSVSGFAVPFKVLDVGPKPESVTKGFDGDYFATLMGEVRKLGDGDGSIVRIRGDEVTTFCEGFDDPKGIVFTGEYLVTADFHTVWKIDRDGGRSVLAAPDEFPHKPLYLNDVALEPGANSVLVTDMGASSQMRGPDGNLWPVDSTEGRAIPALARVYRITLDGDVSVAIDAGEPMRIPNGVDVLEDGTIRIAEFFTGDLLEWRDGVWSTIGQGHRSIDALNHDADGNIYLSEVFTGNVYRMAGPNAKAELIASLSSAADQYLDEEAGVLVIPDSREGELVFMPVGNQ